MTSNELLISAFKKVVSLPESRLNVSGDSPLNVFCRVGEFNLKYKHVYDKPTQYFLQYKTMETELTRIQYDELREHVRRFYYNSKSTTNLKVDDTIITELKNILK